VVIEIIQAIAQRAQRWPIQLSVRQERGGALNGCSGFRQGNDSASAQ
jgi:hypothetical protein